ncbi:MAG: hypothetical protein JO322_15425 [Candidatus Eremiobacteraeota bacterium]|nr:hypothetical protein [Candidatus Eremiobacteraeota bacterium]
MKDRDIREELEETDAEMLRQEERGPTADDELEGYDKTDADSFPASDPPEAMEAQTPDDVGEAAGAALTGIRPREDDSHED